ncbi:MAG: radical SAM protein [Parcubacteria group bacterium]
MKKLIKKVGRKVAVELAYTTGKNLVRPEFVSLVVTNKCNFRCVACSIWKLDVILEMEAEKWLEVAEELTSYVPKNSFCEINGGEPLLRKGLVLDLVKKLKTHFNTVALNSNGSLINEMTVQELENAKLDILKISFYSLDKNTHDFLRGAPAYNLAIAAIKILSGRQKIKVEAGILITAKNLTGLPELIDFLASLDNVSIILQPLDESIESAESKKMEANNISQELWPDKVEAENFFVWLLKNHTPKIKNSLENIRLMREYYADPRHVLKYRCFAGQKGLIIQPDGTVRLCFKRAPIGNIRIESLKKILSGKNAEVERRQIKKCGKYCRIIGCNYARGLKEMLLDKINPLINT